MESYSAELFNATRNAQLAFQIFISQIYSFTSFDRRLLENPYQRNSNKLHQLRCLNQNYCVSNFYPIFISDHPEASRTVEIQLSESYFSALLGLCRTHSLFRYPVRAHPKHLRLSISWKQACSQNGQQADGLYYQKLVQHYYLEVIHTQRSCITFKLFWPLCKSSCIAFTLQAINIAVKLLTLSYSRRSQSAPFSSMVRNCYPFCRAATKWDHSIYFQIIVFSNSTSIYCMKYTRSPQKPINVRSLQAFRL